jgi:hypothetical protein
VTALNKDQSLSERDGWGTKMMSVVGKVFVGLMEDKCGERGKVKDLAMVSLMLVSVQRKRWLGLARVWLRK